jgi:hypothetical protein
MGVEFTYWLVHDETRLERAKSLEAEGVGEGDVLWLEVEIKPFAAGQPASGELGRATFRNDIPGDLDSILAPRKALLSAVTAAGFGVLDDGTRRAGMRTWPLTKGMLRRLHED